MDKFFMAISQGVFSFILTLVVGALTIRLLEQYAPKKWVPMCRKAYGAYILTLHLLIVIGGIMWLLKK